MNGNGQPPRILARGGVFLYPADAREGYTDGRLRLVYEAHWLQTSPHPGQPAPDQDGEISFAVCELEG